MYIVHVHVHVLSPHIAAFCEAAARNAGRGVQEPGCLRFDVVQSQGDAARFVLVEIYRSAQAPAAFASMVVARVRNERWRSEQHVDRVFNVEIAVAVLLIVLAKAIRTLLLIRQFAPSVAMHRERAEFG